MKKIIEKIGSYTIYEDSGKYIIDSGKLVYNKRFKKYMINKYREVKEFIKLDEARGYIRDKNKVIKKKIDERINKLPKSLYLVLIKEEESGKYFIKVGITSKKYIMRRFSKVYGYEGYILETIIRRVESDSSEILEGKIKDKLNKNKLINKYRPLMESFSGYSECYDTKYLEEIVRIFDDEVKKIL